VKSKTTGTYLLIALAAVGVLLTVFLGSLSVEAVYPFERMSRLVRTRLLSRVRGAFRGARAEAENVRLRQSVASLSVLRGELERLDAENARLRAALGYVEKQAAGFIAAGVLSRGGAAGVREMIRVDRGSLDGVTKGAVVTVPEGLVGLVTAVSPHTAEITLVTDPSVKVACRVETPEPAGAFGILCGGSDDSLRLRYLSNAEEVPPRSRVLTSGKGGVFPPGIEIGTLLDVRQDGQGLSREGEVLPSVDYSTLEDVFIRRAR